MGSQLGEFEQFLLFALVRLGDEAHGVSLRQEIERLKQQRREVQAQLDELRTAGENAWGRCFLIGVLEWAEIKSTLETVRARIH